QAEDAIRDRHVTGVQTCALPISLAAAPTDGPALLPGHHGPGRPLDLVGHPMSLTSRHVTDQDASDETLLHDQPVPGTDMPHEFEIGRASCRERMWMSVTTCRIEK